MTGMILAFAMFLQQTTAPVPKVSGPIEGPGVMYSGLRDLPKGTELADFNYVEKEYFVSGTANGKPYTTRIVVREPKDPKKFSGIVVSEIMHSSGNSWMFFNTHTYVMSQGDVHVEIASQKAPDAWKEARLLKTRAAKPHRISQAAGGPIFWPLRRTPASRRDPVRKMSYANTGVK